MTPLSARLAAIQARLDAASPDEWPDLRFLTAALKVACEALNESALACPLVEAIPEDAGEEQEMRAWMKSSMRRKRLATESLERISRLAAGVG